MPRLQAVDALEKGVSRQGILKREIVVQGLRVEFLDEIRMGEQGFDFRAEQEVAVRQEGVMHRFDAEIVPREEQGGFPFVPDGEGKHAAQPGQQVLLPLLESVEQHLAVRLGGKDVPGGEQLLPQGAVVVYLAVEHQHLGTVFVIDRLAAPAEVDDAQAAEGHGDGPIQIGSFGIRPAVGDPIGHLPDDLFPPGDLACKPAKSAHIGNPLFLCPDPGLV